MIRAWHFTGPTMRDGRAVPKNGVWLKESGKLAMCEKGLHASKHPLDALKYAPGFTLCLVDLDGEILEQHDKCCASKRLIISRFDAKPLCLQFARDVASDVLHLWDAPQVVKDFLVTGKNADAAYAAADATARAAADAAYAAADAARAAYAAARAAADAAYAAADATARAAADAAYAAAYAARAAADAAYAAAYATARAAADAAYAAAYATARAAADAAYAAADAAYAAARAADAAAIEKYRNWFLERVQAQFKEWL